MRNVRFFKNFIFPIPILQSHRRGFRMRNRTIIFMAIISVVAAPSAYASISLLNLPALTGPLGPADDGFNVTVDNDNNLQWLDFTLTTSMSYNDVTSTLLGSGQVLDGWRYADEDDWRNLAISAGAPSLLFDNGVSGRPYPDHETLKAALGRTYKGYTAVAISGVSLSPGNHALGSFGPPSINKDGIELPNLDVLVWTKNWSDEKPHDSIGNALVREVPSSGTVPEPAGLLVWSMLGTLSLLTHRRFRKGRKRGQNYLFDTVGRFG